MAALSFINVSMRTKVCSRIMSSKGGVVALGLPLPFRSQGVAEETPFFAGRIEMKSMENARIWSKHGLNA